VVSLAVALIIIAILLGAFGLFVKGATVLLWIGIALLIGAVVVYLVGGRRSGPPL
jgi:multisubunit Na+/H+ antiporter MnhC subunit